MAKKKIGVTRVAGGVVINPEGRIALVEQADGTRSLPKGKVKKGEKPLAAAYREIYEETGIPRGKLTLVMELGFYKRCSIGKNGEIDHRMRKKITIFLFTTEVRELVSRRKREIRWVRFVSFFDAPPLLTHPEDQAFLRARQREIRMQIPIGRSVGVL